MVLRRGLLVHSDVFAVLLCTCAREWTRAIRFPSSACCGRDSYTRVSRVSIHERPMAVVARTSVEMPVLRYCKKKPFPGTVSMVRGYSLVRLIRGRVIVDRCPSTTRRVHPLRTYLRTSAATRAAARSTRSTGLGWQ